MSWILRVNTEGDEYSWGYKPLYVQIDSDKPHHIRFCFTTAIEDAIEFSRKRDAENFKRFLDYWGLASVERVYVSELRDPVSGKGEPYVPTKPIFFGEEKSDEQGLA